MKKTAQTKQPRRLRRFTNRANRHATRQELQATKNIRYTLVLGVN